MIKIENLSYSYENKVEVLKAISLNIDKGENVGLIGANGAGKSTLLKTLVGLTNGYKGEIRINDLVLGSKTLSAIRKQLGYVFQDSESQLFLSTVYEDVAFAPRNYGYNNEQVEEKVKNALTAVGAMHLADRKTYKLSGGEKKLVAIATILSMEPEVLLMDEPSIALDPRNRRNLINLLNTFSQTKIIASHDLDMILDTCERTVIISDGQVIADGFTNDLLRDKELLEGCGLELPLCLQK